MSSITSTAGHVRRRRALAVLSAGVAALAVWSVATLAGADLSVRPGGDTVQPVGPVSVAVSALLAGLAGWAYLAVLERYTSRAATAWTVTAVIVLLLSLVGPLGGGVDGVTRGVLAGMHIIVGVVLIVLLRRSTPRR